MNKERFSLSRFWQLHILDRLVQAMRGTAGRALGPDGDRDVELISKTSLIWFECRPLLLENIISVDNDARTW